MKCSIKISHIETIHTINGYWTNEDYITLLKAFNYDDAATADPSELLDLLEMAISDFEPDEAAAIMLNYKLSAELSPGQIKNLSHEMIDDNQAEEYPDIALHYPMFNINQLLHKAYNGVFPNAKASKIELDFSMNGNTENPLTKGVVLQALSARLAPKNLIVRLFEDQLSGKAPFPEADGIIWEMHSLGGGKYTLITSDYWINKEDILEEAFETKINLYEPEED